MPRSSATQAPILVWFRQDFRLSDNPALNAAMATGAPVIPLYILDDETPGRWRAGGASRWWLHHSLAALDSDLKRRGSSLVLRHGESAAVLDRIVAETGANTVLWNRLYEPWAVHRDTEIKTALSAAGLRAESFNANLLFEPWEISTRGKEHYRVFTPFWRACLAAQPPAAPLQAPRKLVAPAAWPATDDLGAWHLTPSAPNWAEEFPQHWTPGETGARQRMDDFLDCGLAAYDTTRNRPDRDGTARLSPHLHWGEIGPRQIWHQVQAAMAAGDVPSRSAEAFLREIGWREFSASLLFHNPDLPCQPLQAAFAGFPWQSDDAVLRAWQHGRTGYPIVDAGMRQLWQTGWMHNRVRMIVGSFLVKHLLQPWQAGEAWFWDTLVDADLANNAAGWQWIAGSGADAAPYFRVFNPVLQGEKFDPDGAYVRRWVPELARLPTTVIHQPWTAPANVLAGAGVILGSTYPRPIIDQRAGRERALAAWRATRNTEEL